MSEYITIVRYNYLNDKYGTVEGSKPWNASIKELKELLAGVQLYGVIDGARRTAELENEIYTRRLS